MSGRNFSQKTNRQTCFSILTVQKYLKLKFKFQVFPDCQDRKTNSSVRFFGKSYCLTILFRDLLTFTDNTISMHPVKIALTRQTVMTTKLTCLWVYAQSCSQTKNTESWVKTQKVNLAIWHKGASKNRIYSTTLLLY